MVGGKGDGFGTKPEMVRPFRQGVGDEHVQAFDPIGMPPPEKSVPKSANALRLAR